MIEYVVHAANLAVSLYAVHRARQTALVITSDSLAALSHSLQQRPLAAAPAPDDTEPRARHDVHEIKRDGKAVHRYTGDDHGVAESVYQQLLVHHPESSHSWHKDGQLHQYRSPTENR